MFIQMCEAVAATHRIGISHRDIKPENFICCDEEGAEGLERRVIVKLTDWGLGTSEEECGDFDCGSKPYVGYPSLLIESVQLRRTNSYLSQDGI